MNSGRHRAGERDYMGPVGKKLAPSRRDLSAAAGQRVGAASISQRASLGNGHFHKIQEAMGEHLGGPRDELLRPDSTLGSSTYVVRPFQIHSCTSWS